MIFVGPLAISIEMTTRERNGAKRWVSSAYLPGSTPGGSRFFFFEIEKEN